MGRQKGIVTLSGTLGGLNFYFRKGVPVVRMAGGGFSGERIRKSPTMARTRENASEFGRVSKAKKLFRVGLFPFLKDLYDTSLHGRMMRLFQTVKALDTVSARGERFFSRGLATDEGKALLMDFSFTERKATALVPGTFVYDAATSVLTVDDFKGHELVLPKGATGLQLSFGVLVISFEQAASALFSSTPLLLDSTTAATSFTLTPTELPSGDGFRIAVVAVRYYQEVNGQRYLLQELSHQGLEVLGVN